MKMMLWRGGSGLGRGEAGVGLLERFIDLLAKEWCED